MLTSEQIRMMMDNLEEPAEDSSTEGDSYWDSYWENLGDPVNNPSHYQTDSGFEVIDVIDAFVPDSYSYYMGNAIKYLSRHMNKGKPRQDLEKARWYLNKMIEEWEK